MWILMKFLRFSFLLLLLVLQCCGSVERKPYIVYMGHLPSDVSSDMHHDMLASVTGSHETASTVSDPQLQKKLQCIRGEPLTRGSENIIWFVGFVEENNYLVLETEGVVSVFPSSTRKLHTTQSWDFLGFPQTVRRNLMFERDVIIGMIDTGVSPHSHSFSDGGIGPPPARWKGKCEQSQHFNGCNNKIVGARYYRLDSPNDGQPDSEILTALDTEGHGTHTASTAAGSVVEGASLYGLANGTARSAVPGARLAIYKVCWGRSCSDINILAAFDDAIADGVDVISVSLGGRTNIYFRDTLAIGPFHAMANGIITVMSGGNEGPQTMQVVNVSPWVLTVAATSTKRRFQTKLELGNGIHINGISINTFSPEKKFYPIIAGDKTMSFRSAYYDCSSLETTDVDGKIVLCSVQSDYGSRLKQKGAVGMIIADDANWDTAFLFVLPAVQLNNNQTNMVYDYYNSSKSPRAYIYKTHEVEAREKHVASFSSRGPNTLSTTILKPDIAVPGIDILAAYTSANSVTGKIADDRKARYNILSGTSMACPHVSGAAAYVKSFHPRWSPAAIKSALMTTAKPLSDDNGEFAYGSGLFDPKRAVYPGLVYDMNPLSYAQFLCKEHINGEALAVVTAGEYNDCSALPEGLGHDGLNYPSMQVQVYNGSYPIHAVFHRTVTNVGPSNSVYTAVVSAPSGLEITVTPQTLSFSRRRQRRSFKVEVKHAPLGDDTAMVSASLVWDDSRHTVRSPIVVFQYDLLTPGFNFK